MLKRKLELQAAAIAEGQAQKSVPSNLFAEPIWERFYNIERKLNTQLAELGVPDGGFIKCTYNPVEYAAILHCGYLRRYLNGSKAIMFIGMNPGPNGMGQTGVPFGNVRTVRDIMQLSGEVLQPPVLHSKRPVNGLNCTTEEPSGVRLWELFQKLAGGNLDTFSQQCFVHNFCPLAFFDAGGRNITPSELKAPYKQQVRDLCLDALEQELRLVQPQIVVAVGDYVFTTLKRSVYCEAIATFRLPHPSPRALNNTNWPEKAQLFLEQHDLIKYMRNEA
ncbi:single-strand selective monofunctional uracil-DNA glycosylase [Scaptodrosophila lebanonensis]|uniref:Single-strand selective monofunctional uracil-DNA glycosylase n=1 Tax=Drosophila lebanonensis TaxID=7225 RepID=A0A6J2T2P4_DROLE|nr:single-strand selective monofunctional uracil-DNA glycosylase [Scaptodrosophila lebanonensis]